MGAPHKKVYCNVDKALDECAQGYGFDDYSSLCAVFTRSAEVADVEALPAEQKIELSKFFLAGSSLSMEKIAFASGYDAQGWFSNKFLEKSGMRPNAYRQAVKNGDEPFPQFPQEASDLGR